MNFDDLHIHSVSVQRTRIGCFGVLHITVIDYRKARG